MNAHVRRRPAAQSGGSPEPEGLPEPLARLYEDHFDFVWRNARRLGVPAASAEDVVQDVFLIVHRRIADFRGGPPRPWIFGILRRVVSDYQRTYRRKSAHWVPLAPDLAAATDQPQHSPSDLAERAERMRLVESILGQLTEQQRTLIVLGVMEQWTLRELAEHLACNLQTVYTRLQAAKSRLQKAYRQAIAALGSEP